MKGTVFSIEEFSVFDGPGIRTTVFLKGCPLRCQWCHNPEGQHFEPEYLRSPNGCTGCLSCLQAGKAKTGTPCLVEESIYACPRDLVRLCGDIYTPEALTTRLEKKLWLLNAADGGVTFSGGEPLAQPEFLTACLGLLEGKTHRALQTSGFAPEAVFTQALESCEFVLYDLKHMNPAVHSHYTGADNTLILKNYRILVESGKAFITRLPLIPGVNDTEQNLTATAEFMQSLGVRHIELLPYNRGAGAKYKSLGRSYQTEFDGQSVPQPHEEIFMNHNIEVNIL